MTLLFCLGFECADAVHSQMEAARRNCEIHGTDERQARTVASLSRKLYQHMMANGYQMIELDKNEMFLFQHELREAVWNNRFNSKLHDQLESKLNLVNQTLHGAN